VLDAALPQEMLRKTFLLRLGKRDEEQCKCHAIPFPPLALNRKPQWPVKPLAATRCTAAKNAAFVTSKRMSSHAARARINGKMQTPMLQNTIHAKFA
jgi:hypothetical protein